MTVSQIIILDKNPIRYFLKPPNNTCKQCDCFDYSICYQKNQ